MKIERKAFSGVMNTDDPIEVMPGSHHLEANNIVFKGSGSNMKAQNLPGNRLVDKALPSGTNKTIGAFYDALNNRIFFMNYNSNANHGIYIYNTLLGTFQTLLQCGASTDGDILGFDADKPITSINIIYGDITEGDLLCFVDSLKRPTKLNIQKYLASTYSVVKRSYIDVIKAPPSSPIKAAYGADLTISTNNLKNGLFQFIYRFVYDDNEKSAWSTGSEVPLPYYANYDNNTALTNSKYLNNYIAMYFNTGDINVKKIELAFRETRDGATGDYSLIKSFDKSDLSISSNDVYNYNFYKSGIYTYVDKQDQISLFDYVPDAANTQELLNGSILIYGGITEGYDNPIISASITQQDAVSGGIKNARSGLLFNAEKVINNNTIKVYVDGTASLASTDLDAINNMTFDVYAKNAAGLDLSFSFVSTSTSKASLLSGLSAAAVIKGFTVVSTNTNYITLSYTNVILCGAKCSYLLSSIPNNNWEVIYNLYQNAVYQYGIVYYDANGKTNGVNTIDGLKLNTSAATTPEAEMGLYREITINNLAPTWATSYQIVRTKNLSYGEKSLFWVSSGAFSDKDVIVGQKYTYLKIDNIYDYNEKIKATQGVIGYDFSTGDRVKFLTRYTSTGGVASSLSSLNYDYEIVGIESNPKVSGIERVGSYLKISYPTNDISASFAFNDTPDFQNYKIFIYNPSLSVTPSEQTYFEIGHKFNIYNRYHLTNYISQTDLLGAKLQINDGDVFYRNRDVIISPSYQIQCAGVEKYSNAYVTYNLGDATQEVSTTNYNIGYTTSTPSGLLISQYPSYGDPRYNYQNKSAVDQNVNFKLSYQIWNSNTGRSNSTRVFAKIYNASTVKVVQLINPVTVGVNFIISNVNIDATIKVPAGYKCSLICTSDVVGLVDLHVASFAMNITPLNTINITVDDYSISDTYKLEKDSSSRPLVVDADAKKLYSSTMVRYGQSYEVGTNVNQINKFYAADFDTYDKKYGDIVRMRLYNKDLRIFQYRKCGTVPVFAVQMSNQDGTDNLVASSNIINPIRYYDGDFGIGNQPTSLASSGYVDYFVDPVKGYILRLSQDGITAISESYKVQTFAGNNLPKYLNNYAHQSGGNAKIMGVYHFSKDRNGEFISTLQAGTGLTGYTIAFDEARNCFTSMYSFNPEWSINYENKLVTFKSGKLYIHDSSTMNNFYGVQYDSSIKVVFNDTPILKHRYNTITTLSNVKWLSGTTGDITTNLGQSSKLIDSDYIKRDDKYHAAFKRDVNSIGGLYNGRNLKGSWISLVLKPVSPQNLVDLYYIEITTLEPLNNR